MAGSSLGSGPVNFGDIHAVGLLNTAQRGEWLVIWDVQANARPTGGGATIFTVDFAIMHGQTGTSIGTEPNNPLASDVGALPGQVWGDVPGNEVGGIFASLSLPANGYQWVHDWPFCAIAPGDSVVGYSDANQAAFFGIAYIYEVVPNGI
jgi:hypothetical protein